VVTGAETGVDIMLNVPSEGPQFGVQPIGSMSSEAVRVCGGEWALWMSHTLRSLVCAANGLAGHPNPCGVAFVKDLHKLRVPCCSAGGSILPLGTRFVVEDMLTHFPRWDSSM